MSVQRTQPGLPDPRLGSVAPISLAHRTTILRGHEASVRSRAKDVKLGEGPTPPKRFSWEDDAS